MSDKVKLIIEIPKETKQAFDKAESNDLKGGYYDHGGVIGKAIQNGIPLDSNSEKAEVQAYFDGQAYGWEEGRKALIDDVKAEIETDLSRDMFDDYGNETALHKELWEILDNIGKETDT